MTSPLHTTMPLSAKEPSFFEIFMADRLHKAMEPSMQQLITAIMPSSPSADDDDDGRDNGPIPWRRYFNRMVAMLQRYQDEVTAFSFGCAQLRCIWTCDALLGERLYGLRRAPCGGSEGSGSFNSDGTKPSLSKVDRWRTIAWAVLVPYFKRKLDQAYAATKARAEYQPSLSITAKLLLWLFPWFHFTYEGSALMAQLLCLVGASPHFHASQYALPLCGLKQMFVRAAPSPTANADHNQLAAGTLPASTLQPARPTANAGSVAADNNPQYSHEYTPDTTPAPGGSSARTIVIFAVVLFKSLEWWRRSGRDAADETRASREAHAAAAGLRTDAPAIPPPPPPRPLPRDPATGAPLGVPLPLDPKLCPLCLSLRANTAASPGGATFCYRCLAAYVKENGCCPVTRLPCGVSDIRRIYDHDI